MENWKDIKGYEGKYQISNLGRVKSLGRIIGHGKGIFLNLSRLLLQNMILMVTHKLVWF